MQLNTFPAARGWIWLRFGFVLYRRNPLGLMSNIVMMWLTLMLSGMVLIPLLSLVLPREQVSWLSQLPLALLLPALSVGIFRACHKIDHGEEAPPATVFSGLSQNLSALLTLGAIYYAGSLIAIELLNLVDGGLLLDVMRNPKRLEDRNLDTLALAQSGLMLLVLSLPVMMINWFAPVLAGLCGIPPIKAAFFSIVACWRNWRALISFGLAVAGVFWILPALLGALIALVAPPLGVSISVILPLLFTPALYGAIYANTLDVLPDLAASPDADR